MQALVEDEKPVEPAHRRDQTRHRPRRQATHQLLADEFLERAAIERFHPPSRPGAEGAERGQVARVALERVFGQPPLDAEMIQIRFDHASI